MHAVGLLCKEAEEAVLKVVPKLELPRTNELLYDRTCVKITSSDIWTTPLYSSLKYCIAYTKSSGEDVNVNYYMMYKNLFYNITTRSHLDDI